MEYDVSEEEVATSTPTAGLDNGCTNTTINTSDIANDQLVWISLIYLEDWLIMFL